MLAIKNVAWMVFRFLDKRRKRNGGAYGIKVYGKQRAPPLRQKKKKLLYFDSLGNFLKFTQLIPLILISQPTILMVCQLETGSRAQR